jgi:hypothetical protein
MGQIYPLKRISHGATCRLGLEQLGVLPVGAGRRRDGPGKEQLPFRIVRPDHRQDTTEIEITWKSSGWEGGE